MKRITIFLLVLFIAKVGFSQPACGNFFLFQQAHIDAFAFNGCTSATTVFVLDNAGVGNDITNLDGLSNLVSIDTLLIISNPLLENIDGLSNVTSIEFLEVNINASLINLDGLSNCTSIDEMFIFENPLLTNIDGFSKLNSMDGNLFVGLCASLSNIDGFSNLNTVGGGLSIFNNALLNNLDGFSNLNTVGGDLYIGDNPSLNSVSQFCGLFNLLNGGGISESQYFVVGNGYNPTYAEILTPGVCSPSIIPTLSEWGLITLCLILIVLGVISIKQPDISLKRALNNV